MRRLAVMVLAALPAAAWAQDAVIRIEAKRDRGAAEAAAAGWAQRLEDVVLLPLPGGWTGIAIGPLERAEAEDRLAQLRASGAVPADSFVSMPAQGATLIPAVPDDAAQPTAGSPQQPAASQAPLAPKAYLRLEAFSDRAEADAALTRLRREFPAAGMWQLPDGWYALTLGPVIPAAGQAWLPVLADADLIPDDAMLTTDADLGRVVERGQAPRLPAPDAPQPLPPLEEVQRALRWAGHYDGEIDGTDGPMTRAAIRAEITGARASTDPGTAVGKLIQRRAAWRDEMGLETLEDAATGLSVTAPMEALDFDRAERALSIYGPQDGSGAALILFSQPGGQQELLDLTGLVTALGWVPRPERRVERGHVTMSGENENHIGAAEGWVRDGRAEGFVLIWPASDPEAQARILAELSDSLTRHAPGRNEGAAAEPAMP
ncbi:peptidoglycan-binding protein [Paracoccus beibuensis]|uniref:peptidoglycan-binding protein n=1 Tax=Paracoccus beibuensis TaxID=547602 RepID=UPI00223F0DCE|nr:peptidoglycan-binding domain-containing protein [Paracoccus beibuensis]